MTTTAAALLELARCLGGVYQGVATGGSTSTLLDTNCPEPDEWFNGGTIWFLTGNNAGKSARIDSYDLTTGNFSFAIQAGACAAGDRYAAIDARWTREQMVQALNQALQILGPFDAINETLTTLDDQEIYALPAGVNSVKQVWIAINLVEPWNWAAAFPFWQESGNSLYLDEGHQPAPGYRMRLIYEANHTSVYADADSVTDDVHPQRLAWEAAYYAALLRGARTENAEAATKELAQVANMMRAEMRKFPIPRVEKTIRPTPLPYWS
jgi:hypothetical protein